MKVAESVRRCWTFAVGACLDMSYWPVLTSAGWDAWLWCHGSPSGRVDGDRCPSMAHGCAP